MASQQHRRRRRRRRRQNGPRAAPTTIHALGDDLLREVFLRLPALPSLVRAALTCRTFRDAVRSSPNFRSQFRALHEHPFIGLFTQAPENGIPSFTALRRCSRALRAVVRGSDFSLADFYRRSRELRPVVRGLPDGDNHDVEDDNQDCGGDDREDGAEEEGEDDEDDQQEEEKDDEEAFPLWEIDRCCDGYIVLFNQRADRIAAYNPLTRALHLFPLPPHMMSSNAFYIELHIISSEEDPDSHHVVCFSYGLDMGGPAEAFGASGPLLAIISSDRTEWLTFPNTAITGSTGRMVNGSVYWTHPEKPYMTVLNTATRQFSQMELASHLEDRDGDFVLGTTKDGRLCIVHPYIGDDGRLEVHMWRHEDRYDNGVERWVRSEMIPLKTLRRVTKCSKEASIIVRISEVIDGIVYLHTDYHGDTEAPQLCLSFCLETGKLKKICKDYHRLVYPYIMAWPPSLVHDKVREPVHLCENFRTKKLCLSFCLETGKLKKICKDYHRLVYPYIMAWPPSLVHDKGPCSENQSTPSSERSDVKAEGSPTGPSSVAKT